MKNKPANEDIDAVQAQCLEKAWEPFPGIAIVARNLPNGFAIGDQSGCADPKNRDREIGVGICRGHLRDRLWKLYGFALKGQFGRGDEEQGRRNP